MIWDLKKRKESKLTSMFLALVVMHGEMGFASDRSVKVFFASSH